MHVKNHQNVNERRKAGNGSAVEVTFSISGMSCGNCAAGLEKEIQALEGVQSASASHVLSHAVIRYDPAVIGADAIGKRIRRLGYEASERRDDGAGDESGEVKRSEILFVVGVGGLLVAAWMMRFLSSIPAWLPDAISGFAALVGGYPIASKAVRSALRLQLNVDALVVIAASAAFVIGNYLEAGVVIFILLLGELLERITVSRTSSAIRGLGTLLPDKVNVKRDGDEIEVACSEIAIGDVIIVRSGERIAVDGIVLSGTATVDQSPVTGESMPVEKNCGDEVYSGTLSQLGAIEIRATKVGRDSTVAKIRTMIVEAQENKAEVQRLVDRFAAYFVPAMLVIAAVAYAVTGDIQRAITILIVACPCAFVLGTPTAMIAAIGAAARKGVVIRGGDVLETLGRIDGVVFDKTGTLTRGVPRVMDIRTVCGHSEKEVLKFAAVAEKLSEHPLGRAILEKAGEWELVIATPDKFCVKRGHGIEVSHDGLRIVLGNRDLLADNGIALPADAESYMQERELRGETILILAHDKEVCGLISLADPVRKEAPESIRALKECGVNRIIAMYTGDNNRTALSIAGDLGIEEVAAGLLPEDKVSRIKALKDKGYSIAMVGDGINDAPALATADVGIAMGVVGSDITMQAASVILLNDNLSQVPSVIALGRKTLGVVRQNLAFALLFNATMIFLASGGFICMVVGAICHQASSLFVILNSMRLLRAMKGEIRGKR
ncbi:MAG: cation-translocating P-type ATPase [Victivallales bacterium]